MIHKKYLSDCFDDGRDDDDEEDEDGDFYHLGIWPPGKNMLEIPNLPTLKLTDSQTYVFKFKIYLWINKIKVNPVSKGLNSWPLDKASNNFS